jgi:bifunctional DNA-binding transcriptional regulator/antitoxin component of YhaV-PrlF toxin-antitoxin module
MDADDIATSLDNVDRATTTLYKSGHSEHITLPKPLRDKIRWKHREDLVVIVTNADTITIVSMQRHMRDLIEADRRTRAGNGADHS